MDTCGGGHFLIRKEKVADSKISGYVWTGSEANCFFQISLYSRAYVRITFKKTKREFPWEQSIACEQQTHFRSSEGENRRPEIRLLFAG